MEVQVQRAGKLRHEQGVFGAELFEPAKGGLCSVQVRQRRLRANANHYWAWPTDARRLAW